MKTDIDIKERIITIILAVMILIVPTLVISIDNDIFSFAKDIVLVFCSVVLLFLMLFNYKKFFIDKKDILILIFAGLIFISTILSSNFKISVFGQNRRFEGLLSIYSYIIVYFAAKKFLNFNNKKALLYIFYTLYLFVGILGILQYFIKLPDKTFLNLFQENQVFGTFGNINFMGSFLCIGLPIFIVLFITKKDKMSFVISNILFFDLIACRTRSAWLAAAIVFSFIFIYTIIKKDKKYFLRTLIIILCFSGILLYLFLPRKVMNGKGEATIVNTGVFQKFKNTSNEIEDIRKNGLKDYTGTYRAMIWRTTLNLIKKYPVFGVGIDNLTLGIFQNETEDAIEFIKRTNSIIDKAHNEYLQIAATTGIPSLIIYLVFIFLILKEKFKMLLKNNYIFALFASILCYLIQAFFNISTVGIAPLFWIAIGLIDNKHFIDEVE